MKKKTSWSSIVIPCIIGLLTAGLYLFPFWTGVENRLYDFFLGLKSDVKEDSSIVLLDIDDVSIEKVGLYPWPRNTIAKGLEALMQIGAEYAVFDIEYIDKSPMSVDFTYLNGTLQSEFSASFEEIGANVQDIFAALANNQITLPEAGAYGKELVDLIDQSRDTLYQHTKQVAIENDSYLGQAMRLFGSSFITVNMQDDPPSEGTEDLYAMAEERFVYPKLKVNAPLSDERHSALVPIPEISRMAAGAGFTNVHIDSDGVRRRIRLTDNIGGTVFMQLAFSPLLRKLGAPEVVIDKHRVTLTGAVYGGKAENVSIPLDASGMMLIRWPKKNYQNSFTHIPFYLLIDYAESGEKTASTLRLLRANQGWNLGPGYAPIDTCMQLWAESEELRRTALESGAVQDKEAWLTSVRAYWAAVKSFFDADYGASVALLFDEAKQTGRSEDAALYDQVKADFETLYANAFAAYTRHTELETALADKLKNAFCIIGWSSTGTTDIGVNPFHSEYVNVGTHAAVANTILQRDFLRQAPVWVSALLAIIFSFAIIFIIRPFSTLIQIIAGVVLSAVVLVANHLIFSFTGVYIFIISPVLALFVSFLTYSMVSFIISEREKSFLRKAFGTYLSGDVINEIIEDPSMLKLGGQKKWITAMFTDVKGFSTISEALDAEQLVKLLNIYLSGMSDIILEQRGTIDKYEGDAIISFFGAPVDYQDHARLACRAAVLMHRKEVELNELFTREGMSPNPLLTRIGINTGDMVVGNMGTERKMDYTIMGNAVNLAARLEGVNKQYGSWLLISDMTKNEIGDEFITRRFDRVRVVGINTPVQLWELVELKEAVDVATLDFLRRFEEAHCVFDRRDWKEAFQLFKALCEERPDDGPSDAYLRKCEAFIQKPPADNWDGVFSLTQK